MPTAPAPSAPARPTGPTADPNDPLGPAKGGTAPIAAPVAALQVDESQIKEAVKATYKFIAIAGVGGALAGLLIGNVVGTGSEKKRVERIAITGAGELLKDVETANAKIKELAEKIAAANKSLKEKKFPDTFASELGGLNVPFDGSKLVGKGTGSYDSNTLKLLFAFTSDVDALNNRKDALKSIFTGQKAKIEQSLKSTESPVVGHAVIILKGQQGTMAMLGALPTPFDAKKDWPKEFQFVNPTNRATGQATRYDTGEPFYDAKKPLAIPIEPSSVSASFPDGVVGQIIGQVIQTGKLLNGSGDEDDNGGLIKNGAALAESLKKIADRKP